MDNLIMINKKILWLLLSIIATLSLACGKKNTKNVSYETPIYSEIIKRDLLGVSAAEIKNILGNPETIIKDNERDIWSYGPSIEDMVSKEDGAIIGLTIYFDDKGKVISVSPKNKTSVEINQ